MEAGCGLDTEIVDCAALDMVLHTIHHVACAYVEDLDVGQVAGPVQAGADVGEADPKRKAPTTQPAFKPTP